MDKRSEQISAETQSAAAPVLAATEAGKRAFGLYAGLFTADKRFLEPISDEEIGWPSQDQPGSESAQ